MTTPCGSNLGEEGARSLATVDIEVRGRKSAGNAMMEALTRNTGWIVVDAPGDIVVEDGRGTPGAG